MHSSELAAPAGEFNFTQLHPGLLFHACFTPAQAPFTQPAPYQQAKKLAGPVEEAKLLQQHLLALEAQLARVSASPTCLSCCLPSAPLWFLHPALASPALVHIGKHEQCHCMTSGPELITRWPR